MLVGILNSMSKPAGNKSSQANSGYLIRITSRNAKHIVHVYKTGDQVVLRQGTENK